MSSSQKEEMSLEAQQLLLNFRSGFLRQKMYREIQMKAEKVANDRLQL